MSALPPSSFGVSTTTTAVDVMEAKKQQQQQQQQQELCKKHADSNAPAAALSSLGISPPPCLGAAIYGQLVTLDQLSQLGHHHHQHHHHHHHHHHQHHHHQQQQQQQRKQQQQLIASAASALPMAAPTAASTTSSSSLANAIFASAYANLDPSYSLKGKPCSTTAATSSQQQVAMEVEAMELSGSSGSPLSTTAGNALDTTNSNAYSYPTFPFCTFTNAATTVTTSVAMSSTASAASTVTVAAPVSGDAMPSSRVSHLQPKPPPPRLLVRMSVKLIQTYETINEVYFRKKRQRTQACDRKGCHEVVTTITNNNSNNNDHCGLLNGSGSTGSSANATSNRSFCGQSHHGETASGWNAANVVASNFLQQQHLYDVGHQPSPIPPPTPTVSVASSIAAVAPRSIQASTVGGDGNTTATSNSRSRQQGANDFLKIGNVWLDRYEITDIKGKGTFGQVFRAHDRKTHEEVAIKVIKSRRQFLAQAEIEIKLLREIAHFQESEQRAAEVGANYVVNLKGYFTYQGHWCLVFECLSYNLYELLTYTHFRGVSLHLTLKFARQLCAALVFLSRPDVRVIHCDLKPENILLVTPKRSDLKVIDFGSSCHVNENVHQYIQSRFYRSPEVLLNLDYGLSIDMWSLGCILVEMHTGEPLFSGSNELEQLLQIVEVLGLPPIWMLEKSPKLEHFFECVTEFPSAVMTSTTASSVSLATTMTSVISVSSSSSSASNSSASSTTSSQDRMDTTSIASTAGVPNSSSSASASSAFSKACITIRGIVYRPRRVYTKGNVTTKCCFRGPHTRPLHELLGRDSGGPAGRRLNEEGHAPEDYDKFIDLVQKMLVYDPRHRIKPDEALVHRFFERKPSSSVSSNPPGTVFAEGHPLANTTMSTMTSTNTAAVGPAPSVPIVPKRFAEDVQPPRAANISGGGGVESPAYLTFAPQRPDQPSTTQTQL